MISLLILSARHRARTDPLTRRGVQQPRSAAIPRSIPTLDLSLSATSWSYPFRLQQDTALSLLLLVHRVFEPGPGLFGFASNSIVPRLLSYPGTARMARALLGILFVVAMIKTVIKTMNVYEWWFYATPAQVEGLLRVCQLLAILIADGFVPLLLDSVWQESSRNFAWLRSLLSWSVICLAFVAAGVAKAAVSVVLYVSTFLRLNLNRLDCASLVLST